MARLEPKFYSAACWKGFTIISLPALDSRKCNHVGPIPLEYMTGLKSSAHHASSKGDFLWIAYSLFVIVFDSLTP